MSIREQILGVSVCLFLVGCNDGGGDRLSESASASASATVTATVTATATATDTSSTASASEGETESAGTGTATGTGTGAPTTTAATDTGTTTPVDETMTGSGTTAGTTAGTTGTTGTPGTTGTTSTSGAPASCGDGQQDPGEECEDGAQNGPDQPCYANCTLNGCGDGVNEAPEECDLGAENGPDSGCSVQCKILPSACGKQNAVAEITKKPVDIVILIDNSGSMSAEIKGVESNINKNFADILAASGLDYRVIMVSGFGKNSSNRVCIEAPLGGIPQGGCLNPPAQPVNNPGKFYHYSVAISSVNAACKALSTIDGVDKDQFGLAPTGWQTWLREDALKVFMVITDDRMNCSYANKVYNDGNTIVAAGTASAAYDASLLAKSPLHFGTIAARNYLWYSIVGMAYNMPPESPYTLKDPLITAKCPTGVNGGLGYQALSNLTDAWRFPLCDTTKYNEIFDGVAKNVVASSKIACDFVIPPPPEGKLLDKDSVVVSVTPAGQVDPVVYDQVPNVDMCTPMAFYVEGDKVILCPEACMALQANADAEVEVEFTCEPLVPN